MVLTPLYRGMRHIIYARFNAFVLTMSFVETEVAVFPGCLVSGTVHSMKIAVKRRLLP